ncbi:MAG: cysteine--tRNA ligase [Candidatus Omnitrophica bacterium]|nr:cysteine--tRNA ligase [Candidatus Omnitrophota bacterium]
MAIKVLNTLSGKKEFFKPQKEREVKIYLCGPTVYDEPHLGHLRSAYDFDVIRRYFLFKGYQVYFLRNVTDVDDKIIQKAKDSGFGDLIESTRKIAEKYYRVYKLWMDRFGIMPPDIEPWATEHINEMVSFIQRLIEKGFAYESGSDVYFSVRSFKKYGRLSGRSLDDMIAGARVVPGETKRDPLDFALWKKSKDNEPSWESPWGRGRPGWHIECSVMSTCYLGETFDIHAGGRDLIFPHHENEIAQAEAATGKQFANYWLHNGMLTINGEKMAKSLNNFVTVEEVLKKIHPDALKIFFLSAKYNTPIDFSWARLNEAKASSERFDSFFARVASIKLHKNDLRPNKNTGKIFNQYEVKLADSESKFRQAMDDDFNTALALSILYEILSEGNRAYEDPGLDFAGRIFLLVKINKVLHKLGSVFSLFSSQNIDTQNNDLINSIIKIRDQIRASKNFELADKIRSILQDAGIIIEDSKSSSSWRKLEG